MKIAINLLPVVPGRAGGQEVYARGILQGLLELDDLRYEVVLLTNQFNDDSWPADPRFTRRLVPLPGAGQLLRVFREQQALPAVLRTLRADVVHSIGGVAVLRASCPNVVTIHDLLYLHHPETFSRAQLAYRKLLIPPTARRAAHLVADSDFTRDDLIARLAVEPSRVSTVYLGIGANFRQMSDGGGQRWTTLQAAHGLDRPYVFYPGTLSPHKDIGTLVRALAIAARRGVLLDLVLAGPWQHDGAVLELRSLATALGTTVRLRPVGYVTAEDLAVLYNNATVHVLPSTFEGFGLTVVEAMACGCPVVASRRASIPELAGDAALLVEAGQPEAFAGAICRIVWDAPLRERLRAAGVARATRWSWRSAAQELVDIYERSAAGARTRGVSTETYA
jgi:glycosyltransferase involved in cell wall biosynthesis